MTVMKDVLSVLVREWEALVCVTIMPDITELELTAQKPPVLLDRQEQLLLDAKTQLVKQILQPNRG